jgi:hypothetical protein
MWLFAASLLAAFAPADGPLLWRDPGRVETIDFTSAARGATDPPRPPFRFAGKPSMGTSAKVEVVDALGRKWRVKSGPEARVETFVTRLVSALGYFAEVTWFVESGVVEAFPPGLRSRVVDQNGRFTWVGFELIEPDGKFLKEPWAWTRSPFAGTRELQGLKILVMLVSNWDNKDARDSRRGSNVGVLETGGVRHYLVNDWGQSMGAWKTWYGNGTCWDCEAYRAQTEEFVRRAGGAIHFGYRGQHTRDFAADLSVEDVRWLMQYLGKVTDAQIRTGLLVSGATRDEQECFAAALRKRIEQLRNVAAE